MTKRVTFNTEWMTIPIRVTKEFLEPARGSKGRVLIYILSDDRLPSASHNRCIGLLYQTLHTTAGAVKAPGSTKAMVIAFLDDLQQQVYWQGNDIRRRQLDLFQAA